MKKILIFLFLALALVWGVNATVYYNEDFSNSSVCSELNYTATSFSCSVTSGVMKLSLRNAVVSGFNYDSVFPYADSYIKNHTYTIIFKLTNKFTGFGFIPYLAQENSYVCYNPCSYGYLNFGTDVYPSFSSLFRTLNSSARIFGGGFTVNYPSDNLTMFAGVEGTGYVKPVASVFSYETSINPCVDNFCVMQLFFNGTGDKSLSYYINSNLITTLSDGSPYNNRLDRLNNLLGSYLNTGTSTIDVFFDRIVFEEGNKIGYYTYAGGESFECSDGADNDLDGLVDFPADPSCDTASDTSESPKDGSLCSEDSCTQSTKCVYTTDFNCNDELKFHGWTSYPEEVVELQKSDGMKILLNKYLQRTQNIGYVLPNGSIFYPIPIVLLYTDYSDNKKDYTQVQHNFEFYFVNNYMQYGITESGALNESVQISFIGDENHTDFAIQLKPTSLNYEPYTTNIEILATDGNGGSVSVANTSTDNLYKFELNVITYKPYSTSTKSQYDFTFSSPDSSNQGSWKYSGNKWNFSNIDDTYITSITLGITGDSAYTDNFYPLPDTETLMYLSSINVEGLFDEAETTTQCTTWETPYLLKEYFNGCINTCRWVTNPTPLCLYGALESTIADNIYIAKATDPFSSEQNRYATLSFYINPSDYDPVGGVLLELLDTNSNTLVSLLLSNNILYNQVDGNYEVLYELQSNWNTNVQLQLDFVEDTFDFYIYPVKISSNNKFANTLTDFNNLASLSLFSVGYAFKLTSLSIFTTDSNNIAVPITPLNPDQYIDNGTKYCGHMISNPPSCSSNDDCVTDECMPNGVCNSFDMNYCDENGYARGSNSCFASAMVSCAGETSAKIITNNFFTVLIFVFILVIITYVAVMFRRGK